MATIQAGSVGRTDISSHTGSLDRRDNAQFKSVVTVSGSDHIASNYYATAKELYPIGVQRVSGSGRIAVIY